MTTHKKSMKSMYFLAIVVGTFLVLPAFQPATQSPVTLGARDGAASTPWLVSDGGAPPAPWPWKG
jgi:hypothetical protein